MGELKTYDIIIIGGGSAGLSAAIYTARARLGTLLIEKGAAGGQIINTTHVENYPGFDSVSGIDLTQMMYKQAEKFGMEVVYSEVKALEIAGDEKVVKSETEDFKARAVIVASGLERQKLGVPGESAFTGRGVSYCATCDGAFFRDKPVAVAGGGNAAITEALELTKFASKITVIHRRSELRATKVLQEKAFAEPKISVLWDSAVEEIMGDNTVNKIKVRHVKTKENSLIDVSGIFVSVGSKPNTEYLKGKINLDESGSIITNERMETNVPGILAAGDVRRYSIRQLIAAAGDGAVAAIYAEKYISGK